MPTVVTGASGFLGSILTRALVARGRRVRALDLNRGVGLESLDLEWVEGDVLDRVGLAAALEGADVVYHLAGVISITGDPTGRVWATNVDGVRNVAEAALEAGVRRFVHCSSIHAYDIASVRVIDEDSPRSTSPRLPVYDRSKAAGEAALREIVEQGLDAVVCNPTAIIGPGDFTGSRMNTVLGTLFRRRLPALVGGGFDWVDVRDVADSMIAAEEKGRTGENYLLAGHPLSVRDLAGVVENVTGAHAPSVTVPLWFAGLWSPIADVLSLQTGSPLWYTTESLNALRSYPIVSRDKAARELLHRPRPIEDTIADLYRWCAGTQPTRFRSSIRRREEASHPG